MFYNKFNKWISILLCTSICIGSPSITSMANPISAAASQKYQIQSINKDSNNNLLNEVQDFDRQSSYTNIFNTKTTNAINSSNTSVIEDTENSNTETSAIIEPAQLRPSKGRPIL